MANLISTTINGTGTVTVQFVINGTNSAVSTTTGALTVAGGVGIGGNTVIGGLVASSASAPTIASTATIAPTRSITFVSGTTLITNITAPSPISSAGGQIVLIPTGNWTTNATGNIALASTAVTNKALIMTYDAGTGKWYPSY